jgi:hypothetical protein
MASLKKDRRRSNLMGFGSFLFLVCPIVASIFWIDDRPTPLIWGLRIGFSALALIGLGMWWLGRIPPDELPDHLAKLSKKQYFDADGFAFLPKIATGRGAAIIELYFQNQRDCDCIGRVALQPTGQLPGTLHRKSIDFEIECPPGAFGVARLPIAVPPKWQGRRETLLVGAKVEFPDGKAGLLRHTPGLPVGELTGAEEVFEVGTAIVSTLLLNPMLPKTARVTLTFPEGVRQELPGGLKPKIEMLDVPPL